MFAGQYPADARETTKLLSIDERAPLHSYFQNSGPVGGWQQRRSWSRNASGDSSRKSASAYGRIPFIWPYNAQTAQLASSLLFSRIRNDKRASIHRLRVSCSMRCPHSCQLMKNRLCVHRNQLKQRPVIDNCHPTHASCHANRYDLQLP